MLNQLVVGLLLSAICATGEQISSPHDHALTSKQRKAKKLSSHKRQMQLEDWFDNYEPLPTAEVCSRGIQRLREQDKSLDYRAILEAESRWTDTSFLFPESIQWPDLSAGDYALYDEDIEQLSWARLSEQEPAAPVIDPEETSSTETVSSEDVVVSQDQEETSSGVEQTMWGSHDIEEADINQGYIGDCWFMASIAAIAESPKLIKEAFLTEEINPAGVYALQMYLLGSPITVTIDDFVPIDKDNGLNYFATVSEDGAIWGPLLEKAMAKYLGNYEFINGGFEKFALSTIMGAPYTEYMTMDLTVDELWAVLAKEDQLDSLMTAASFYGWGGDSSLSQLGIPYSHAYSLLGTATLDDGTRLVHMRNPWGTEYFSGPWSDLQEATNELIDLDLIWTEKMKRQLGHEPLDDGFIFIRIEDFKASFESVTVATDVSSMHRSRHEVVADDKKYNAQRVFDDTFLKYNVYTFTLTSPVDQKMILSLQTYGDSQYVGNCYDSFLYSEVYIDSPYEEYIWQANPGSVSMSPVEMRAGESFEVNVYTRFSHLDLLPHDWALLAWGTDASIQIALNDGKKEDKEEKEETKSDFGWFKYFTLSSLSAMREL